MRWTRQRIDRSMASIKLRLSAVIVVSVLLSLPARAELSCEQLVASVQAGISLRDQGSTLKQILAETEKTEMRERLKPDELAIIRRAIRLTFTGEVSVDELAENCADGKSGGPGR